MRHLGSGALRARVTLERPVRIDDAGGGAEIEWQSVVSLWASIVPRQGGEALAAGRMQASISHDIVLRHRSGILPEMRFRYGERLFLILAVLEADDRRRPLLAYCRELT